MRIQRFTSAARADMQATLFGCALVVGACASVLWACLLLPMAQAVAVSVGIAALFCGLAAVGGRMLFHQISNPSRKAFYNSDRLTALKSRNAFETDLQNIHAGPLWRSAGLLLVDLDRLKAVNDAMGHTVGDEYLRLTADALRQACTGRMCPYRVGGDEFAVVAPGTDETGLQALEEHLATQFDRLRPSWPVSISLSIGWALFDDTLDRNLYDTYQRADGRMYEQKRGHRETFSDLETQDT